MKKIIALLLVTVLTFSMTACGKDKKENPIKDDTIGKTAVQILEDTWDSYEGEKFALAGGDYENMTMDVPGTVGITNGEALDSLLGFPAENVSLIDDGASMMHMMNQNTFTSAVYHVVNSDDVQKIADDAKTNIMNRQWMCGFPDDLVIYSVGTNYVVIAFGNLDIINNFEDALKTTYESANCIHDVALT